MSSSLLDIFCIKHNVAEFIHKLYSILHKNQYDPIIGWTQSNQIYIKDIKKLEKVVLRQYFRHNKIESFIRQLNMYGFHKINKLDKEKNELYFKNQNFQKNNLESLILIKRKKKGQHNLESFLLKKQGKSSSLNNLIKEQKKMVKSNVETIISLLQRIKKTYVNVDSSQFKKSFQIAKTILRVEDEEFAKVEECKGYGNYHQQMKTIKQFFFQTEDDPYKFNEECSIENQVKYEDGN